MSTKPLSASHIKLWKTCKRRERFVYGLGLREPPAAAAMAGTKVHALLEDWLKNDEKPPAELLWDNYDLGRMAWQLSYKMPDRSSFQASEDKFVSTLFGVEFSGVIDAFTADTIYDFKTTSRLKYVKTHEELAEDEQRLLYVQARPGAQSTRWLYGVWEDFSVHERLVHVDRGVDLERFKFRVLKPAEEILALPEGADPLSLEPNKDSCGLYPPRGCPFKSKCFPVNKTAARMTKLIDKLRSKEQTQVMPLEKVDLINGPWSGNKEESPKPTEKPVEPMVSNEKPIDCLFVDCFPISSNEAGNGELLRVVPGHQLIQAAAQAVQSDQHVHHYGLLDFGKGPVMLAAQLAEDLKAVKLKYVHLETKSAEGRACLNAFMNASKFIVKGML